MVKTMKIPTISVVDPYPDLWTWKWDLFQTKFDDLCSHCCRTEQHFWIATVSLILLDTSHSWPPLLGLPVCHKNKNHLLKAKGEVNSISGMIPSSRLKYSETETLVYWIYSWLGVPLWVFNVGLSKNWVCPNLWPSIGKWCSQPRDGTGFSSTPG
jgi:hypothetical protein